MPFSAPSSPPEPSEQSVRNRLRPKYCNPAQLRGSAVKLFEAGFGYVRAARMLNIPANTVKRLEEGHFQNGNLAVALSL